MKKYALISTIFILMILNSCDMMKEKLQESIDDALEDSTYVVVIPQDIGGKLVCTIHYISNFHSWDYFVGYDYIKNEKRHH